MDSSKEFQLMLDEAIKSEPLAFKGFGRTKNVQDQLQEMMETMSLAERIEGLSDFANGVYKELPTCGEQGCYDGAHTIDKWEVFTSMEQLWLAFVMTWKFNKEWSNGEWILKEVCHL